MGMRILRIAAMIALLAGPAYGQGKAPSGPPPPPTKSQQEIEADRAAEKAYKKSLSNIPDQPPADPWGVARSVDAPKAVAKSPSKRTKADGTANKPAGTAN
jgi:hypothetical protein